MEEISDIQLIQRYLAKGNEEPLEILIQRHVAAIYALARRFTGNSDTASDITQEAFVKAWKNLKRFDRTKNFRTWLFVIAKRTALDELKKKRAVPFSLIAGDADIAEIVPDQMPSVVEILFGRATAQELSLALAQIPLAHRTVVDLHVGSGFTFQEIAQTLEKPLNTVKSQYRRGIAVLKRIVPR